MSRLQKDEYKEFVPYFDRIGLPVSFIKLTRTGIEKDYQDATESVRKMLFNNEVHDFSKQKLGAKNNTAFISTKLVSYDGIISIGDTALYKPETKNGAFNRMSLKLKDYAVADSIIAISVYKKELYLFNLSSSSTKYALETGTGGVGDLLQLISFDREESANNLLGQLREIHSRGFISTGKPRKGDTDVGMVLERELKINANSSKLPDYNGIEIKASRMNSNSRTTLFTRSPNWKYKGQDKDVLDNYGYIGRDGKKRLSITQATNSPNSAGLYLKIDSGCTKLLCCSNRNNRDEYVLHWNIQDLKDRLAVKHRETFWVFADSKIENGMESFRYNALIHTKQPRVELLSSLFDLGIITMDFSLSAQGGNSVRQHGYLFRFLLKHIPLLFKSVDGYLL